MAPLPLLGTLPWGLSRGSGRSWELGTGVGRPVQLPALRVSGMACPYRVASLGALGPERDTRWGRSSISGPPPRAWSTQSWDRGSSAAGSVDPLQPGDLHTVPHLCPLTMGRGGLSLSSRLSAAGVLVGSDMKEVEDVACYKLNVSEWLVTARWPAPTALPLLSELGAPGPRSTCQHSSFPPGSGSFSLQWDSALPGGRARCGLKVKGLPGLPAPLEPQHCPLYSLLGGIVGNGRVGQSLILSAELLLELSSSLERKQGQGLSDLPESQFCFQLGVEPWGHRREVLSHL